MNTNINNLHFVIYLTKKKLIIIIYNKFCLIKYELRILHCIFKNICYFNL